MCFLSRKHEKLINWKREKIRYSKNNKTTKKFWNFRKGSKESKFIWNLLSFLFEAVSNIWKHLKQLKNHKMKCSPFNTICKTFLLCCLMNERLRLFQMKVCLKRIKWTGKLKNQLFFTQPKLIRRNMARTAPSRLKS